MNESPSQSQFLFHLNGNRKHSNFRMPGDAYDIDVLVVGAGPAGMAAGCAAVAGGQRVLIVDDNPALGGQIWRGEQKPSASSEARTWFDKVAKADIEFVRGARVISQPKAGVLIAEASSDSCELRFRKLILATGARERFLPFRGWTLPNVAGAGGLQALVKGGLPIKGKKVIVAGSGPLLLAVATYLRKCGAEILLIAEQASPTRLLRFGLGLMRDWTRAFQAFALNRELKGIPYCAGCWVVGAEGGAKLERVQLRHGRKSWSVQCDYLACGFHLVPNLELPSLLGCELLEGIVQVDDFQETSVPDVYCAGEPTGIGGLELSLIEGQIAGLAAIGNQDAALSLFHARERLRRFARLLNWTFAIRSELKDLPTDDTIVCRCEDVTLARVRAHESWRAAKLQTRCGMGPCQGRICGPATEFLFDWQAESVRPPIFPARVDSLTRALKAASGSGI